MIQNGIQGQILQANLYIYNFLFIISLANAIFQDFVKKHICEIVLMSWK